MTKPLPKPFILLNIPKTGGRHRTALIRNADLLSIARKFRMDGILLRRRRLHGMVSRRFWKLQQRLAYRRLWPSVGYMNSWGPHTPYCKLPASLHSLPVITALREPLSWCVSFYVHYTRADPRKDLTTLKGMARNLQSLDSVRQRTFKSFVKKTLENEISAKMWGTISLEDYWHYLQNLQRHWIMFRQFRNPGDMAPPSPPGALCCEALMFVHPDPGRLFAMSPQEMEAYFTDGRGRRDLAHVRFLRFEHLQEDLRCVMLEQLGYDREILDAAAQLTPARLNASNPARKEQALRELEQKPQLREEILRSERIYTEHLLPLAGNFRDDRDALSSQ